MSVLAVHKRVKISSAICHRIVEKNTEAEIFLCLPSITTHRISQFFQQRSSFGQVPACTLGTTPGSGHAECVSPVPLVQQHRNVNKELPTQGESATMWIWT